MRKKITAVLLFGMSLSLVGMEEVELYPRLDVQQVYHERNPIKINDDEEAPLISSKVDKVKPSLTRRCLRAACGLSSSSPKRCFWTCCGAITCAGGIIGAIAGGIYLTSFPNCPPFTWNSFNAYYEPCVAPDLSSMVSRCQLQHIERSCVPVFREPSNSSYYREGFGFEIWYGGNHGNSADWFECGTVDDEEQFLYVMCNNQTWYDSMRSRLCRFLGRESNCTFPDRESQDKKDVTCARPITSDKSIIGVLTPRVPNIDVLVDWDEYAPIMENSDLIYSNECRAIREPIEQEIREWDPGCPHYPHGAHPRKPHPVDWDHADCR